MAHSIRGEQRKMMCAREGGQLREDAIFASQQTALQFDEKIFAAEDANEPLQDGVRIDQSGRGKERVLFFG